MANLFSYRVTGPTVMKLADNPVGRLNNKWLKQLVQDAGLEVAA